MASKIMGIGQRPRPDVRINLKGAESFTSTMIYSTLDKIEGSVSICSAEDIHIDDLEINFLGTYNAFSIRLWY